MYQKTSWKEYGMTTQQKVDALNNMETQYDECYSAFSSHNHLSRYYTKSEMDSKYFHQNNDGSGSGFVAETLDGYTAEQILQSAVPSGVIAVWYGDINSVPNGWVICDGSNGTPDLRNRFVIGAGGSYAQGTTGGNKNVTPTCTFTSAGHKLVATELPAHTHSYTDTKNSTGNSGGGYSTLPDLSDIARNTYKISDGSTTYTDEAVEHSHENSYLTITQMDIRPPWKALLYIMKV